jgi:hypothetical protein
MLACPFCGGAELRFDEPSVQCLGCGATGPEAAGEATAIKHWNERSDDDDPPVRLEEEPNRTGGLRMTLYYGPILMVNVTHVPERFAATMRGALTLIGGMRQAENNEEVG